MQCTFSEAQRCAMLQIDLSQTPAQSTALLYLHVASWPMRSKCKQHFSWLKEFIQRYTFHLLLILLLECSSMKLNVSHPMTCNAHMEIIQDLSSSSWSIIVYDRQCTSTFSAHILWLEAFFACKYCTIFIYHLSRI